ncbi:hypothetical protein AK812_SmicGene39561, partial [Symbiodinium microadriaticum]
MLPTLRLVKPPRKLAQLMPSELAIREAGKYGESEGTASTAASSASLADFVALTPGQRRRMERRAKMQDHRRPQRRPAGCFIWRKEEVLYPIHVAAQEGNPRLVRALLLAGADPQQKP